MPTLTHNKDAPQEQKHQATAELQKDKSFGHEMLNDLQKQLNEMREKVFDNIRALIKDCNEALSQIKILPDERWKSLDSFALVGPEHGQTNKYSDQVRNSLEAAVQRVLYAADSMTARHQAAASILRNELQAKLDAAQTRDQSDPNLTASDRLARQQEHEKVVAGELETLAKRELYDIGRLQDLMSDTYAAIRSLTQDAQANVAESAGRSNEQELQISQERLQQFNEQHRNNLALRIMWDGRLSDVQSIKTTWDKAAAGPAAELKSKWDQLDDKGRREAAERAYDKARDNFWSLVNQPADEAAREVHRLMDSAGAEWQKGKNAPLLQGMTITLDHVANKAAHPSLALDASNLRFLTKEDNSARGNKMSVTDRRNVDFVTSEERQVRNAKRRDQAAEQRFTKSHAQYEALLEVKQRLKQKQDRVTALRQKEMGEAVEKRDKKVEELRTNNLRLLNGEDESLRRARQNTLLDDLNKFLNAALKQSTELQQFELSMHERQQQELSQELKKLAGEHGITAQQVVEEVSNLERRFTNNQSKFEGLWRDMDKLRNLEELRMLRAIYEAATRQAQEENIKRVLERQQQMQQDQERRLRELAEESDAHD